MQPRSGEQTILVFPHFCLCPWLLGLALPPHPSKIQRGEVGLHGESGGMEFYEVEWELGEGGVGGYCFPSTGLLFGTTRKF